MGRVDSRELELKVGEQNQHKEENLNSEKETYCTIYLEVLIFLCIFPGFFFLITFIFKVNCHFNPLLFLFLFKAEKHH